MALLDDNPYPSLLQDDFGVLAELSLQIYSCRVARLVLYGKTQNYASTVAINTPSKLYTRTA